MSENMNKQDTAEMPKVEFIENKPKGQKRYCVVAKGLTTENNKEVIVEWGFTDKQKAEAAALAYETEVNSGFYEGNAAGQDASNMPAHSKRYTARVVREPKTYTLAPIVTTVDGQYMLGEMAERQQVLTEDGTGAGASDKAWIVALMQDNIAVLYDGGFTLGKKIAVGAGCILIAAGIAGAVAYGAGAFTPKEQPVNTPTVSQNTTTKPTVDKTDVAEKKAEIHLRVNADGAKTGSTKVNVSASKNGEVVIEDVDVAANEEVILGELTEGEYALHVSAVPVREDGSTFKLPEHDITFTVGKDGKAVDVEITLEVMPVEEMTREQLEQAATALEQAGDTSVAEQVREQAQNAVSVPGSAGSINTTTPSVNNNNGNSGNGGNTNTGGSTTPADPTPAPAPSTPEPEQGSQQQPSQQPEPEVHIHNPSPQEVVVGTKYHEPVYETVHYDAVVGNQIVCHCGTAFATEDAYFNHSKAAALAGNAACGGYSVRPVVITPARDEQVLVKDGWTETITETRWVCSTCGEPC